MTDDTAREARSSARSARIAKLTKDIEGAVAGINGSSAVWVAQRLDDLGYRPANEVAEECITIARVAERLLGTRKGRKATPDAIRVAYPAPKETT